MSSRNLAIILGRLGKDPEIRYLPDGKAVASVSIATSERWTDKNGEKREATEWHAVAFFGKLAELAQQYLKKGAIVYVEGKLHTRSWDKDGQKHYKTEIRAERMQLIGGKPQQGDASEPTGAAPAVSDRKQAFDDDEIPF